MDRRPLADDLEDYARNIVDTVREPLLILDATLRVRPPGDAAQRPQAASRPPRRTPGPGHGGRDPAEAGRGGAGQGRGAAERDLQQRQLLGCTRDELIGAPFKDYFTDPERAQAGIKRVLAERKLTDYELTARARDGTETVVSYNATTVRDRDRMLQGVFAAARDVTERKRYEQSLQQANRAKSVFLANMSHEIRTPPGARSSPPARSSRPGAAPPD